MKYGALAYLLRLSRYATTNSPTIANTAGALPDFYVRGNIIYKLFDFYFYVTHLDKNFVSNVKGCSQATFLSSF